MNANTPPPVLTAKNLGIQFGGLKAVSDFNIEIGPSELLGLIGPNGAEKQPSSICLPAYTVRRRVRST
jgi:ABC-type branched-subunit amino acid transport system ATPase component